jgi:hypothetical protein
MVLTLKSLEKGIMTNCLLSGRSQVQLPPRTLTRYLQYTINAQIKLIV